MTDTKKSGKLSDYICGTSFQALADFVWNHEKQSFDYMGTAHAKHPIVYVHTHYLKEAKQKAENLDEYIILMTHNSDGCVRAAGWRDYDISTADMPINAVKWYAQNVDIDLGDAPLITPVPIGLENRYCYPEMLKPEQIFEAAEKDDMVESINTDLYFNCNLNTNMSERVRAYEYAQQDSRIFTRLSVNGIGYDKYLADILSCFGTLCPIGNGLDCHRQYEVLYLNRIPVMPYVESFDTFDLPILFIDDWSEIQTNLDEIIDTLRDMFYRAFVEHKANLSALSMEYWKNKIYEKDTEHNHIRLGSIAKELLSDKKL